MSRLGWWTCKILDGAATHDAGVNNGIWGETRSPITNRDGFEGRRNCFQISGAHQLETALARTKSDLAKPIQLCLGSQWARIGFQDNAVQGKCPL